MINIVKFLQKASEWNCSPITYYIIYNWLKWTNIYVFTINYFEWPVKHFVLTVLILSINKNWIALFLCVVKQTKDSNKNVVFKWLDNATMNIQFLLNNRLWITPLLHIVLTECYWKFRACLPSYEVREIHCIVSQQYAVCHTWAPRS